MNYIILITCIIFFNGIFEIQAYTQYRCDQNSTNVYLTEDPDCHRDWLLVFEDEFNGTTLDFSQWDTLVFGLHGIVNTANPLIEREYYGTKQDNVELSNGKLKLIAKYHPNPIKGLIDDSKPPNATHYSQDGQPIGINQREWLHSSGIIFSKRKFTQGKFEIRCKLPPMQEMFPAFWLYGDCQTEIDIFEFKGTDAHNALITYYGQNNCSGDQYKCQRSEYIGLNGSSNMATYTLEWDDNKMKISVNGIEITSFYRFENVQGVDVDICRHSLPLSLLMNNYFPTGDNVVKLIVNNGALEGMSSTTPLSMEVEYVKVYYDVNPSENKTIYSLRGINDSAITGGNITVKPLRRGDIVKMYDGDIISLVATNSITLEKDIVIEEGAVFNADIRQPE